MINARTDAFFRGVGSPREMLDEAIRRGRAYRDGSADCLFVPGVTDPEIIHRLVREIDFPINVLAVAGSPPIGELARLGVARVSLGSGPVRAALTLLDRLAGEIAQDGTYSALEGILPHARINELMEERGSSHKQLILMVLASTPSDKPPDGRTRRQEVRSLSLAGIPIFK